MKINWLIQWENLGVFMGQGRDLTQNIIDAVFG